MDGVQKNVAVDLARGFARGHGATGPSRLVGYALIGCVHDGRLSISPDALKSNDPQSALFDAFLKETSVARMVGGPGSSQSI
jgi:hypothetical protein